MDLVSYFQSYEGYFWDWGTDEDIPDSSGYNENNFLYIPDVGTISYRAYVIAILKEFTDQGFPPFGSLLLVLYAVQNNYLNLDDIFSRISSSEIKLLHRNREDIESAIQFLNHLNELKPSFKKNQNKIILLKTIFKNCHNQLSEGNSKLIIKIFERNPTRLSEAAQHFKLNLAVIDRDVKTLALLHHKFPTVDAIVNAMYGYEVHDLEDEVIEEETTVETDKDFIRELIEEPKTFQVGSLIKRIWSGLKIPMRHLSPGEQPIGGISDMTNKGELHRMLLSEFANEDEVFMSRVANNEALYIQREIPPEENIFERIILIDTSLKNWGTPKVLAFASAIAVIKHPKAHSECKVFALGQNNISISLNKVEEVIENLNQVSPVLEVSEALEKFFDEEHTEKDLEVFFITHQENLANPNLQKVVHENRDRLKFLVTTSSNGELNFYKHHKGTRKHIQKIVLPLKELWANPPQRRPKGENSAKNWKKTDVPMNYPILFPMPTNKIESFLLEGEFLILSSKKQLLKTYLSDNYYNKNYYDTYKTHRGCEVLFENISFKPKGQFALAKNRQLHYILCQYQPDKKLISKLNLNTGEYSETNVSLNISLSDLRLVYFNKKFYLWNENSEKIEEINIDGNIISQSVKNDKEIKKNHYKVAIELKRLFTFHDDKILSNYNRLGINKLFHIVISQFELLKTQENSLRLYRNKNEMMIYAQKIKNKFIFSEGSEIIADSRGILTFKSANSFVPVFYLATTTDGFLAITSDTEFGGSEYYLPETTLLKIKTVEHMYSEYVEPFIHQVLEYGT